MFCDVEAASLQANYTEGILAVRTIPQLFLNRHFEEAIEFLLQLAVDAALSE